MEIKEVEIWKDIKDYPNYKISNLGRVKSIERLVNVGIKNVNKSIKRERVLKFQKDKKGYLYVRLYNNLGWKYYKMHTLVANSFIKNCKNKTQVNHIDGNKENNRVENLEWTTCKENIRHAIENGLINKNNLSKNMRILGRSRKGILARWKTHEQIEQNKYKVEVK